MLKWSLWKKDIELRLRDLTDVKRVLAKYEYTQRKKHSVAAKDFLWILEHGNVKGLYGEEE